MLEEAWNTLIAIFHWFVDMESPTVMFHNENRKFTQQNIQFLNSSFSQNSQNNRHSRLALMSPSAYSDNQYFSSHRFAPIMMGKWRGRRDTRRLRCYRSECRLSICESCSYCSNIPYVPSQLRQGYYPQDFECYDFGFTDSESDTYTESDYQGSFNSRQDSSNNMYSVNIRLNYLLTEIHQIMDTDENEHEHEHEHDHQAENNVLTSFNHRDSPTNITADSDDYQYNENEKKKSNPFVIFSKIGYLWKPKRNL